MNTLDKIYVNKNKEILKQEGVKYFHNIKNQINLINLCQLI